MILILALKGYYNGKEFVPLEKVTVKQNQKVIITILDDDLFNIENKEDYEDLKYKLDALKNITGIFADEGSSLTKEFDQILLNRLSFDREALDL